LLCLIRLLLELFTGAPDPAVAVVACVLEVSVQRAVALALFCWQRALSAVLVR